MQEAVLKEINNSELKEQEASDKSMDEVNEDDFFWKCNECESHHYMFCTVEIRDTCEYLAGIRIYR